MKLCFCTRLSMLAFTKADLQKYVLQAHCKQTTSILLLLMFVYCIM